MIMKGLKQRREQERTWLGKNKIWEEATVKKKWSLGWFKKKKKEEMHGYVISSLKHSLDSYQVQLNDSVFPAHTSFPKKIKIK